MAQESEDELISQEQQAFEAREADLASQEQDSFEAREADLDAEEQDSFEAREDDFDAEEQDSFEAREADFDAEEEDSFEAREDDFESEEEEDSLEARVDEFFLRATGKKQRGFCREMLAATNKYRKCRGARPLKLDAKLSRSARKYAKKLARLNKGLPHSKTKGVGENLYTATQSRPYTSVKGLAKKVTDAWYNEYKRYKPQQPETSKGTGHFTQLVWKGSQRVGIGYAFAQGKKKIYVVAQYSPQGNIRGKYKQNVGPAQKC